MKKIDKLIQDFKSRVDFIKAYLGEEDIWIIVSEITYSTTSKYREIIEKYFNDKNVLIIERIDEKDLLEDIDKRDYKVAYK